MSGTNALFQCLFPTVLFCARVFVKNDFSSFTMFWTVVVSDHVSFTVILETSDTGIVSTIVPDIFFKKKSNRRRDCNPLFRSRTSSARSMDIHVQRTDHFRHTKSMSSQVHGSRTSQTSSFLDSSISLYPCRDTYESGRGWKIWSRSSLVLRDILGCTKLIPILWS